MSETDQTAVKAFLADPSTHGGAGTVERVDTHISHLFLTGDRVFKLKRAMSLPYLDFSTAEQRLAACEKELRLNCRTAPELYLGVRRITDATGGPEFDGAGALLDAVVEMRRFDQDGLFDAMAQRGALTSGHLDALAREITAFHAEAPVDADANGADNIASVLRVNAAAFRQNDLFAEAEIARLDAAFRPRSTPMPRGWTKGRARVLCGAVTAICTCATSAFSRGGCGCSIAWSSTMRLRPWMCSMIWPFWRWICGIAACTPKDRRWSIAIATRQGRKTGSC